MNPDLILDSEDHLVPQNRQVRRAQAFEENKRRRQRILGTFTSLYPARPLSKRQTNDFLTPKPKKT